MYVRHGEATVGEDQPNFNFLNCLTQRNLFEKGRLYYGQLLRYLQIPVSYPIISGPFCRNIEKAQLAFGIGTVQIAYSLYDIYRLSGIVSEEEKTQTLTSILLNLEKRPQEGTNQIIIAHSFPKDVGLGEIPFMGTVVIEPLGEGKGYNVVKRFSLDDLYHHWLILFNNTIQ